MNTATSAVSDPRKRRVSRPVLWIGGLVALVVLVAALAPWTVSRDALREEIAAQLRSSAGVYVFPRGPARITILPRPRVSIDEVAFVDPKGALVIEAPRLTGDIRLLPLLAGRLEVAEIALSSPQVTIDIDRAPLTAAGAAVRAAETPSGSAEATKADAARLGVLSVTGGTIILRRGNLPVARAERVSARMDWRSVGSPAALTADLDWRGLRQQFVLWVSEPAKLLRGGSSPLTLEVRTAETRATTAGVASIAVRPRFEGQLQALTGSVPEVLAALGIDITIPAALNVARLDGNVVVTPTSATMTDLHLDVGDETFEGTLALQTPPDAAALLSGTLATQSVSLAQYLPRSPALIGPDGRYSSEPFDAAARKGPDLDLRLSAARVRFDRLQASDAALSLTAKQGRLELIVADATAYGGQLKGRAVVTGSPTPGKFDLQATLLLRGVDWGALDRDVSGQGRLTGTADLNASVQSSGESAVQMVRSLAGQGRIAVTRGDLGGLDVPGTLSRLDKRPLAAATDLGSGRTRFDRASVPFEIEDGVAKIVAGEITAPDFTMALQGSVQMTDGVAAMTATVRPAATPAANPDGGSGFAFEVAGPWNRPNFIPDIRGLMRRSGAASPLFGTVSAAPAAESR